jgi:enolase-phosphatase E1
VSAEPAASTRAILLDIEGTTTPIAFVFDVLFPYARTHLREHLLRHAADPALARIVDRLKAEHAADHTAGQPVPRWTDASADAQRESAAVYVEWLMDRDRKSTPLKELQGWIWEEGYRRRELASEVFSDVVTALERWTARGLRVAIFSSGSVRAQRLLFEHAPAGDLGRFLSGYFDTTIGAKVDPLSYRRIAEEMNLPPSAVLFVSDVTRELDAAREAGMQTRLSIRPRNPPGPSGHGHVSVTSFDELCR